MTCKVFGYIRAIVFVILVSECLGNNPYKNISDYIFSGYDSGLRPHCSDATLVKATIGLALRQVIDLDEPNQVIKLNLWIRLSWNDCLLKWDPTNFEDVGSIVVPNKNIWIPDLTIYDSVSTEFFGLKDYNPTVYSDGSVFFNFPTLVEVLCPIDVTSFPFDTQICKLMFGSWTYHGFALDWTPRSSNPADLSAMKENVEWIVPNITVKRHEAFYTCCPEPYPDITFYFKLERKPSFYITNIIIPSLMITILLVLGYILPVNSGEKVSLEITVMLAMSVFQLLVADKLPPSADSTPWIGIFFNFILGLSGVSTILQVIVINIYFREEKVPLPFVLRYIIRPICLVTFVDLPSEHAISCCKSKKVNANLVHVVSDKEEKESKENDKETNCEIWRCFSVSIDRLGLFLFTLVLTIGGLVIFQNITTTT